MSYSINKDCGGARVSFRMARLVLCVLALVASGLAAPEPAPAGEHEQYVIGKYV